MDKDTRLSEHVSTTVASETKRFLEDLADIHEEYQTVTKLLRAKAAEMKRERRHDVVRLEGSLAET
jgi:hypothetical protein